MDPRSVVAVVAAALALLAGCSGPGGTAGKGVAGPDPSEAVSTSSPASPSASATATDAPPAVAPATGASLKIEGVRLRAPLAFSSVPDKFAFRQEAYVPSTNTSVSVFRFPNLAAHDKARNGTPGRRQAGG